MAKELKKKVSAAGTQLQVGGLQRLGRSESFQTKKRATRSKKFLRHIALGGSSVGPISSSAWHITPPRLSKDTGGELSGDGSEGEGGENRQTGKRQRSIEEKNRRSNTGVTIRSDGLGTSRRLERRKEKKRSEKVRSLGEGAGGGGNWGRRGEKGKQGSARNP